MQGMIGHHAQALEMTALLPSRTAHEEMKLLAKRIEVSQTDEIKMMQRWLEARGLEVPSVHAHHAAGATLMPGMLTPDEMSRLADAKGAAFDRLFLELMIKHHEGALIMVKDLLAQTGAAQGVGHFRVRLGRRGRSKHRDRAHAVDARVVAMTDGLVFFFLSGEVQQ